MLGSRLASIPQPEAVGAEDAVHLCRARHSSLYAVSRSCQDPRCTPAHGQSLDTGPAKASQWASDADLPCLGEVHSSCVVRGSHLRVLIGKAIG